MYTSMGRPWGWPVPFELARFAAAPRRLGRSCRALAAGFLVLVVAGSCTLTRTDVDACQTTAECRQAFGFSATCSPDGSCQVADAQPRCMPVLPADLATNPVAYTDILLVGTVVDLSLPTHAARARSVQLAIRDANAAGGLSLGESDLGERLSRPFGLVVCDNAENVEYDVLSQEDASVAVTRWLRDVAGVAFIVGPPSSDATRSAFLQVDDVLLISPSASSDDLTLLEPPNPTDASPGRLWRTAVPDGEQAMAIVEDLQSRSIQRLAVLYAAGSYGTTLAEEVGDALSRTAMVSLHEYRTDAELAQQATAVAHSDADEVLFISPQTDEVISFLNTAANNERYDDKRFFVTDAAANQDFVDGIPSDPALAARIRGTRPMQVNSVARETFVVSYGLEYDEDPTVFSFAANAYDAAWLGLYAVAWAHHQEPDMSAMSMASGLRKVSDGPALPLTQSSWETLQGFFAVGTSVDVDGASGRLDYDLRTEELNGQFEVWVLQNGRLESVPPPPL